MTPDPKSAQDMETGAQLEQASTGSGNALPIGTRLAEFEISEIIGEGGFGTVYLAFDHSLQRTVAIKEYMPALLSSRGASQEVIVRAKRHRDAFDAGLKSFINEARILAQFDHPSLIKVYRFWEQNNTAYMAMRYYEGKTFRQVIQESPQSITEAWLKPVLKPLLEALDTLYRQNILHRDISPDNIMIQPDGSAVLLDFGAARQIINDLTQVLTVILKPGYAPIEQYADDQSMKQGPWTDIYALSAVMYFAIAKKPPATSVARMIKDPVEMLAARDREGFSKDFLAAIDKGMAVNPEDRPQSISEFIRILKIDAQPASPRSESKEKPAKPTESSRKRSPADETPTVQQPRRAREASRKNAVPANRLPTLASWGLIGIGVVLIGFAGMRYALRTTKQQAAPNAIQVVNSTPSPASGKSEGTQSTATKSESAGKSDANPAASAGTASVAPTASVASAAPNVSSAPASTEPSTKHATAASANVPANDTSSHQASAASKAATPASAQPTPTAEASHEAPAIQSGIVRFNVRPWGSVYVDGTLRGVSPPMKRLQLDEGKHQVRIVNPNFPEKSMSITINAKRSAAVDVDFGSTGGTHE